MESNDNRKKNGIFYTPSELADFMVQPVLKANGLKILDPAYGEGSLLLAAERVTKNKTETNKPKLFGCDIKPINGLLKHLPEANLQKIDFFRFSTANKFDLVLMNPPYVRHHFQNDSLISQYRQRFPDLEQLSMKSDLWAYFLLKATMHLEYQASVAAILPWSFIQADYSREVRKWLFDRFEEIIVLRLNDKYFEKAEARVVLVWLKKFGSQNKLLQFGTARNISHDVTYRNISKSEWISNFVINPETNQVDKFLSYFKERYQHNELSTFCDIKIGVVSGADSFFLVNNQKAQHYKFRKKNLVPIISNSKQFNEVLKGDLSSLKSLVCIKAKDRDKFKHFIKDGKKFGFHLREHSKRRTPWYSVTTGGTPDGFFPYRISKSPYILSNEQKIQCTNSVHRLYFKNLTETQIKWIQISILTDWGQLSLEVNAKTYGKMMLKIEPRCLKNTLVFVSTDEVIHTVHEGIYNLLKANDKERARVEATNFFFTYLNISEEDKKMASMLLLGLQNGRLNSHETE